MKLIKLLFSKKYNNIRYHCYKSYNFFNKISLDEINILKSILKLIQIMYINL